MDQIWENLLLWLRSNMSLFKYDTWVKQLKFKGIYGDEFVMIVPNQSTQELMQQQYTAVDQDGLE